MRAACRTHLRQDYFLGIGVPRKRGSTVAMGNRVRNLVPMRSAILKMHANVSVLLVGVGTTPTNPRTRILSPANLKAQKTDRSGVREYRFDA